MLDYGIVKVFKYHPDFAKPFVEMCSVLMEYNSLDRTLSEYIAAKVSTHNRCLFCMTTHVAAFGASRGWNFDKALSIVRESTNYEDVARELHSNPPVRHEQDTLEEVFYEWSAEQLQSVNFIIDSLLSGDPHSMGKYELFLTEDRKIWSTDQLVDIVGIVSLFQMANTLVSGLEKAIDPTKIPTHREMIAMGASLAITGYNPVSIME